MSQVDLDLASATITAMSTALRQRELSPVELITATLERIDALQPGAVVAKRSLDMPHRMD
jgi:Asp-tRNA(Asn)/Glu-tRNA(Gln) amidotransferase A subunit family amidase